MKKPGDLHFAFDVGHSSIGWAVLRQPPNAKAPEPAQLLHPSQSHNAGFKVFNESHAGRWMIWARGAAVDGVHFLEESRGIHSDFLVSLLNEFLYCPRRAALKMVKGWLLRDQSARNEMYEHKRDSVGSRGETAAGRDAR
ncbi:MAG: hypothetical protein FJ404_02100 [Verrucomicrobia bacterium]|nr:hypothetical protein [Verrucomicrobiota bacterium]